MISFTVSKSLNMVYSSLMHNDFGQYKAFVEFMGWKIPTHTHTHDGFNP